MSKTGKRVLIVDEESGVRDALGRLLRRHEMDVSTAVSGHRALKRLRDGESYDCMILDLLLPDMAGRAFVETLASERLFDLHHVIILTALHNVDNATAYLQFGCAGYMGKPYDNGRILQQVERICLDRGASDHLEAIV